MPSKNEIEILVTAEVDKALKNIKKVDDETSKSGKSMGKTLSSLKTAWIAVAAVLTGTVVRAITAVISRASEAEETLSKFNTVFKNVREEADKVAKNLAKNFGLSSDAARKLLSDTGDLLTGFGFTGDSALDLSKQVNELAVDLASFTNFSGGAAGASAALTKALLGERESVKALGISILESDVKAKVFELSQRGITFETERQAKAYATLLIAQEQSKNAMGDFSRTSGSFANQVRKLKANWDNLIVAIGTVFLPIATKIISKLVEFAEPLDDIVDNFKEWSKTSTGLKVLGVTLIVIKGLIVGAVQTMLLLPRAVIEATKVSKDAFLSLGNVIKLVFSGKFKEAAEEAKKTVIDSALRMFTVVNSGAFNLGKTFKDAYNKWNELQKETEKIVVDSNNHIQNKQKQTAILTQEIENLIAGTVKQNEIDKIQAKINTLNEFINLNDLELEDRIRIENAITAYQSMQEDIRQEKRNENIQKTLEGFSTIFNSALQLANDLTAINKQRLEATDKDDEAGQKKALRRLRSSQAAAKALAITQTTIETIVGAQRAFNSLAAIPIVGPALGAAAAIAAGVAGAARVAKIAATPLAQFQEGGISDGGLAVVGERGRELIELPRGARVRNRTESDRILNNSNSISIGNINLPNVSNGEQFYKELQNIQRKYGTLSFGG